MIAIQAAITLFTDLVQDMAGYAKQIRLFQTRAALSDDYRSTGYELPAESFYSEPLRI